MRRLLIPAALLLLSACARPEETPAPTIRFASPEDGAVITGPVALQMEAENIRVLPAGTFEDNSGHFHVVVDSPFITAGSVIPSDSLHIHFGDASTSGTLNLAAGTHTLRLQMGDGAHTALEGLRDEVSITVVAADSSGAE